MIDKIDSGECFIVRMPPPITYPIEEPPKKEGFHYDVFKGEYIPISEWEKTFIEVKIPKSMDRECEEWLKRKIVEIEKRKKSGIS